MTEITQSATPAPVSTPAPVPAPIIPPQINTMPVNTASNVASTNVTTPSTSTSGWEQSFKKAISNPTPIIFGILAATGMMYAIYYYRFQLQKEKIFVKSVQNKMDEIDMKLAEMESYINSIKDKEKNNEQQNQNLFI